MSKQFNLFKNGWVGGGKDTKFLGGVVLALLYWAHEWAYILSWQFVFYNLVLRFVHRQIVDETKKGALLCPYTTGQNKYKKFQVFETK